jgi:hypothetical protein
MAYYLENRNRSFASSIFRYHNYLDFAVLYGWIPKGTVKKGSRNWDGRYHSNGDQQVTREDALEMAAALRRGIKDIPGVDIAGDTEKRFTNLKEITDILESAFEFKLGENRRTELLAFLSNRDERERLLKFIDFITEDGAGYNTGC